MTERADREDLIANLLQQDHQLTDIQMKEYRMKLEQRIEKAERQARQMRIAIYVVLGVWLFAFATAPIVEALGTEMSNTVNVVWFIALAASPLCGAWFLLRYLAKYRPAVSHGRTELQTAMILQLQRQVADLVARLDKEGN